MSLALFVVAGDLTEGLLRLSLVLVLLTGVGVVVAPFRRGGFIGVVEIDDMPGVKVR